MITFKTKYGNAIMRVMAYYPPNSQSLLVAMEAVVLTAMNKAREDSKDDLAQDVCQGLHPDAAKGLVCKRCFDVVESGKMPQDSEDIAAVVETPSDKKERDDIARQVASIIGMDAGDDVQGD